MLTVIRKTILMTLIFSLVFGFSFTAKAVNYTPTVKIKKIKDTYVTLQITSSDIKNKDVKIKVKIENIDSDTNETRVFEKKLNKSGKVDIKITGLTKDNEYSFKVAVKKTSDGDYSDYSDEVGVNSEGAFNYDPVLTVEDETNTAVTINVTSTKLKKKKVKIKVRIENKDTDKIETRIFTKTLNKNGKVEITLDNLSSDTKYSLKALIKKSKDKGFSEYSNEESAETEE